MGGGGGGRDAGGGGGGGVNSITTRWRKARAVCPAIYTEAGKAIRVPE